MKYLVILLILVGFSGNAFAQYMTNSTDMIGKTSWPPTCMADPGMICPTVESLLNSAISIPFEKSDTVVVGKIIEAKSLPEQNMTQYNVGVQYYLKNEKPHDLLNVIGEGILSKEFPGSEILVFNRPIFEKNDRVFLYLVSKDNKYHLLPYSFLLDNNIPRGPPPEHSVFAFKNRYFSEEKIIISGMLQKANLYLSVAEHHAKPEVKIRFENSTNQPFFEDILDVKPDGTFIYVADFSSKNAKTGSYSFSVDAGFSSTGSSFEYIASPLKQFKSGIAPKDVVCKHGLELVMKKSNGQPICVKATSVKTLTLRNYIPEYNDFGGEIPTELSIDNTEVGSYENITKESKFPLWYRLSEAQRIVTESFGKLPITGVGIGIHGELEILIHEDELKKIPNTKDYYEKLFKNMIPFEVPIKIEFGHGIPVDGLNDESRDEENTFFADKDDALKKEILTQLGKEPKNLNDSAKKFILSEALSDKRVSDLLGDSKYQIMWTINSELGESSIKYFYGITFQLNEKDLVSVVYDLQQEKITSVESDEVFGSSSGEEIPSIKISKVDGLNELAIQFKGWTKKPNQEIVLTVTAPNGNIISKGSLYPMNNGTFADAITTGGPLWKQQDGTYLVTVQQGEDHINMAHFEFDLKDGKIIKEK